MLVAVSKIRLRGSVEELLKGFFGIVDGELLIFELDKDDRNVHGTGVRDIIWRRAHGARLSILAVAETFHVSAAPLPGDALSFG